MEGDDRIFRANFTNEGVAGLREKITEKLKEFMGDYTDETLVEYVIVLIKNGRRKDEAKSELHVFLGDDSDSFVTWLWDHLGSHLSQYVQPREAHQDGVTKTKSAAREPAGRTESCQDGETKTKSPAGEPVRRTESHQDSAAKTKSVEGEPAGRTKAHQIEYQAEKKPYRNRHNREWKGIVRDVDENGVHLPQSSVAICVNNWDEPLRRVGHAKRLISPRRTKQKKRRPDEQQSRKRDNFQITVGGARRLLQFAVRDAVRPTTTSTEPSSKRLRSVVATATGDSILEGRPIRDRLAAGSHADMSVAIKAAAEAVNDVNKLRSPHKIFDRLGQTSYGHNIINNEDDFINNEEDYRGFHDDGVGGDYIDEREDITFHEMILPQDVIMSHGDIIMTSDLVYDDERYDGIDLSGQGSLGTSGGDWVDDSLVFPSDEAHDFDVRTQRPHIDLYQPATAYHSSAKLASSVNMDVWRIPQYEDVRKVHVMNHGKLIQDSITVATKLEPQLMKENSNHIIDVSGYAKPETRPQHESQKTRVPTGLYSAGPPTEDADSRTIYVSNVHFAAAKDSLSRHFNKSGEVWKVIILTDPATGQPKGSAYIEFMRTEAAENALSLNGTSFMSRMLKVARKGSAQPEAAPVVAWPRVARASPFPVPRFSRASFGRGIPSLFRPRIPIKPTRSFQWKRGGGTEIPGQAVTRNLTYVRTEAKANGNSGTSA